MKILSIVAAALLTACVANRTTIQSSWADEAYSGPPLQRIAVVALFDTRADSLSFERSAAEHFAAEGVEILPGHELVPAQDAHRLTEAEIKERIATTDVDGLLIFRLVAIDERREYLAPTPYLLNLPAEIISHDRPGS